MHANQNPTLENVIDILKNKGWTDEQIVELTNNITKTSFARLYEQALASFTNEDIKAVEACQTQEETNEKIRQIYTLRTGKDPNQEAQKFIANFVQGFMAEYQKELKDQAAT